MTKYTRVLFRSAGSAGCVCALARSTRVVSVVPATIPQDKTTAFVNRRLLYLTKIICCTSETMIWLLKSTSMASDSIPPWMMPASCFWSKKERIAFGPFELMSRYCAATKASVVSNLQSPFVSPVGYGPLSAVQMSAVRRVIGGRGRAPAWKMADASRRFRSSWSGMMAVPTLPKENGVCGTSGF